MYQAEIKRYQVEIRTLKQDLQEAITNEEKTTGEAQERYFNLRQQTTKLLKEFGLQERKLKIMIEANQKLALSKQMKIPTLSAVSGSLPQSLKTAELMDEIDEPTFTSPSTRK